MEHQTFDVIVLGGGPAGYPAAIRAAQRGKSVALIEAKEMGGTCLNRGCIPSKALIAGGEAWYRLRELKQFGIQINQASLEYNQLAQHKDQVVDRLRKGLEGLINANKITVFRGTGRLVSPREIQVNGKDNVLLTAPKIIIATGSEPKNIPAFPFDQVRIHDSTSLLALTTLPKSLVIIGGGIIGCEFASLYANLGVEVTIVELLPRILPMEAIEISQFLTKSFAKRGIKIETGAVVEKVERQEEGVQVHIQSGKTLQAEMALVSVGRTLNTKGIGLEQIGVEVQANGQVTVNEKMETTVPGIYAVGDIASKWWLAHVGSHQGIIAAENACGREARMSYTAVPSAIFTHPEIGTVGLSLEEAKKQGYVAKLGAFPFQALGKAQAILETEGFAQIVIDEKTGQILGAQVIGYEASTLISEMTVAIANELTLECITEAMHAHPTLGETWLETAYITEGLPVNFPPLKPKSNPA